MNKQAFDRVARQLTGEPEKWWLFGWFDEDPRIYRMRQAQTLKKMRRTPQGCSNLRLLVQKETGRIREEQIELRKEVRKFERRKRREQFTNPKE